MNDILPRLQKALEGRYTIERKLGEGGMATVYLADDVKHERQVALKVLKPELAAVVGAERFLAEIKTTAQLQHPHILPLFDSGEADTFLFYVMPYVEGETLRERIDRDHQLPVAEAVSIAAAVASALQVAHEAGIVHRDIKPGNILMSRGEPLVADFGIALAVGTAGGSRLTETGLSVGTPFYMSPEQATGDQAMGPSSDVYALAAVLYELLVGEPPYPGTTAQAVLGKIIQGTPVSTTASRKTVPAHVDGAIRKALEKLPADRFSTAKEFREALLNEGFRYGTAEAAGAGASGTGWKIATGAALAAAVVFAALFAWTAAQPEAPRIAETFSLMPDEGQSPEPHIAIAADGRVLVYRVNNAGQLALAVRSTTTGQATTIPGTAGATFPSLSPDGSELAFIQEGMVKVVPLGGGLVRAVADSAACCLRWGPDDHVYYSNSGRQVARAPLNAASSETLTIRQEQNDGPHGSFNFAPGSDGDLALFTVFGQETRIDAFRLSTGERSVVGPGGKPMFLADGTLVFGTAGGDLMAAEFDPATASITGTPIPLVSGVRVGNAGWPEYQVSPDGHLLYWSGVATSGRIQRVVTVSRDGLITPVDPDWTFDGGTTERSLSLSPDGTRLAIKIVSEAGEDIWIKQLPDGPLSRLTFDPAAEWRPWWSPDGQWVYFISWRNGELDLYRRRADGTGSAELVLDADGHVAEAGLSPDGEWLILRLGGSVGGVNNRDIAAMRLSDSTMVDLISEPYDEKEAVLSPDGRWLAYSSTETGRDEIYIRPFPDVDGGKWQISTQGGLNPRWARDGEELFFVDLSNMVTAARLELGPGVRVLEAPTLYNASELGLDFLANYTSWDVAPDGEGLLMMQGASVSDGPDRNEFVMIRNWGDEAHRRMGR